MSKLTKELIETSLEKGDMTPFLAIGTIVAKELLQNSMCLVGFNCLEELQVATDNVKDILLPEELKHLSQTELARELVRLGLTDDKILSILEKVY